MARPKIERCLCQAPKYHEFKTNKDTQEKILMSYEEYETILLIDYEHLQQEECASRMGVSRTTVQFIYTSARNKLADFLVNGNNLEIEGGNYKLCTEKKKGCLQGHCCRCDKDGQN